MYTGTSNHSNYQRFPSDKYVALFQNYHISPVFFYEKEQPLCRELAGTLAASTLSPLFEYQSHIHSLRSLLQYFEIRVIHSVSHIKHQ